jgi:hypothetical protein
MPITSLVRNIALGENIIGLILTGFLIAALFRYVNRR